jgi:hypothetical protein
MLLVVEVLGALKKKIILFFSIGYKLIFVLFCFLFSD